MITDTRKSSSQSAASSRRAHPEPVRNLGNSCIVDDSVKLSWNNDRGDGDDIDKPPLSPEGMSLPFLLNSTPSTDRSGADCTGPETVTSSGPGAHAQAHMGDGGRIDISLHLKGDLKERSLHVDLPDDFGPTVVEYAVDTAGSDCPKLNIVIFVVGSRGKRSQLQASTHMLIVLGDVQPYIALALKLIETDGHTVRIATHGEFKSFVLSANKKLSGKLSKNGEALEGKLLFFDAGGDPRELMAYMVKSKLVLSNDCVAVPG